MAREGTLLPRKYQEWPKILKQEFKKQISLKKKLELQKLSELHATIHTADHVYTSEISSTIKWKFIS